MSSSIDQLLLSASQQAEIDRAKKAWLEAEVAGDTAGMDRAHQWAESIRSQAGYSGGDDGDRYTLLKTAGGPAGYNAYEALVDRYAAGGMSAIAEGYQDTLAGLAQEREKLLQQGEANQAGARSAAWNRQRLAADGLLTRGLSGTGLADVITATALNQASANAYQALLDTQNDLSENDTARAGAKAEALADAAALEGRIADLLSGGYQSFYENEADARQQQLLQQMKNDAEREQSALAFAQKQQLADQDYYFQLALQQLKRQGQLEDQARGR